MTTTPGPVRASVRDTVAAVAGVLVPLAAEGAVIRRRRVSRLFGRTDADGRAGRVLARLADRRGTGPLVLRVPGRSIVVLLDPADVRRVLEGTPTPFTAATREKVAALGRFEPNAVLISTAQDRPARRRLNVHALDTELDVHHLGSVVVDVVRQEVDVLLAGIGAPGTTTGTTAGPGTAVLDWASFAAAFGRIVRRVVLGDATRDDTDLTDLLARLRRDGNWGPFHPRRPAAEADLARRLQGHLAAADPRSLAGALAAAAAADRADAGMDGAADGASDEANGAGRTDSDPAGQLPHWLFAYDAAAIASFRALAAVSTHPLVRGRLEAEAAGTDLTVPQVLPFARAVVLESLRLWPTTLVILRESTTATRWGDGGLPAGTSFLVISTYLHRDARRLPYADRLDPDVWLDGRAAGSWSLLPFSGGPAGCPGRNVVLLTAGTLLAVLTDRVTLDLVDPARAGLDPERPLAGSLDHHGLRFRVSRRSTTATPTTPITPTMATGTAAGPDPVRS